MLTSKGGTITHGVQSRSNSSKKAFTLACKAARAFLASATYAAELFFTNQGNKCDMEPAVCLLQQIQCDLLLCFLKLCVPLPNHNCHDSCCAHGKNTECWGKARWRVNHRPVPRSDSRLNQSASAVLA